MDHKTSFNERRKNYLGEKPLAEPRAIKFYTGLKHTSLYPFGYENIFKDRHPSQMQNNVIHNSTAKDFLDLIPLQLKKAPDFILFWEKEPYRKMFFVEAKGCGDVLRIKKEDVQAYGWWDSAFKDVNLVMFIYSMSLEKEIQMSFRKFKQIIIENDYKTNKFPDNNKEYYPIPVEDIFNEN